MSFVRLDVERESDEPTGFSFAFLTQARHKPLVASHSWHATDHCADAVEGV